MAAGVGGGEGARGDGVGEREAGDVGEEGGGQACGVAGGVEEGCEGAEGFRGLRAGGGGARIVLGAAT